MAWIPMVTPATRPAVLVMASKMRPEAETYHPVMTSCTAPYAAMPASHAASAATMHTAVCVTEKNTPHTVAPSTAVRPPAARLKISGAFTRWMRAYTP